MGFFNELPFKIQQLAAIRAYEFMTKRTDIELSFEEFFYKFKNF